MRRKPIDPEALDVYQYPFCARCKKELTEEQMDKAKKALFLPLCDVCEPLIRKELEKCLPLMGKLFRR